MILREIERFIGSCIGDAAPPCQAACPLHIDVRRCNTLISQGNFSEALKVVREKLPFPAIMGRICTHPCEDLCTRGELDAPVAICFLKRSAADYGGMVEEGIEIEEEKGKRIAVIGAGPAGLMAAYDLRRKGYQVTVIDALPSPGGMLWLGIPQYRLPRDVLQKEVSLLEKMGIKFKLNTYVGREVDFTVLRKDFDALFIAVGAHASVPLGIAGEDLKGVYYALDFLRDANLGREVEIGERVAVVGGGNAAVDAARVALRLGAKEVTIIYRRSRAEMPAIKKEVEEAEVEGVKIMFLTAPIKFHGKNGKVIGMECIKMELGEPDESGRRRPFPIKGSEFLMGVDTVIIAIGQRPDLSFLSGAPELRLNRDGTLQVDPLTLQTNIEGVFAGGDAVTGPGTAIEALAAGRKAAISIDKYLRGEDLKSEREGEGAYKSRLVMDVKGYAIKRRIPMPVLDLSKRKEGFQEVYLGFTEEEAKREAERCISCECRICVKECEFLKQECQSPKELAEKFKAGYFREKPRVPYSCNLCGLCEKLCPEGLNVGEMCLEIRRQLVKEGLGPLPGHKLVKREQEWVSSDAFLLSLPDLAVGRCDRVFFPGCELPGYSPPLALKTYRYLQEKLPGTGIILRCCGAPLRALGEEAKFQEILKEIEVELRRLKAHEIIVACPQCYYTFKRYAPHLNPRSLYEVMVEVGIPKLIKTTEWTFSLHDSCIIRGESDIQESVRRLVREMGYRIHEMEYSRDRTRCCGAGGMIFFADFYLAKRIAKKRAEEAPFDILTYCINCRETLGAEKPAVHLLDLVFNPDWEKERLKAPTPASKRRENQALLKSLLVR